MKVDHVFALWRFGRICHQISSIASEMTTSTARCLPLVLPILSGLIGLLSAEMLSAQIRFGDPSSRERTMEFGIAPNWQNAGSWASGTELIQQQDWKLGVTADNTETGVVVRQVTQGSSANRARLEVGDVIIAVGGYQVGLIDGGLFDLGEELRRRADNQGNVTLLVQDHRNGRLASVRVQLDENQSTLRGEVVYRERMALPNDALVSVVLENLTRPFYTVRNGQVVLRAANQSVIPFEMQYDPTYIQPQDIYQVRATITSGGRTILDTRQPPRVLTQGNPSQVQLVLSPTVQTPTFPANTTLTATGSPVVTAGYPNMNLVQDQLTQFYRQFLGRDPWPSEVAVWNLTPATANRMSTLPIEIMGSQEYFDRVGNNNESWFAQVFQNIVGKAPTTQELTLWMQRFRDLRYSRTDLLRQLNGVVRR